MMHTLSTGNKDSPDKDYICNMMEVKRPEGEECEELVLTVWKWQRAKMF